MKRKHKRVISTLLIVLMISTQPAVTAWADNTVPEEHLLGGDANTGKKTGYATPADADQKDDDALDPDVPPEYSKIPHPRIKSTDEKLLKNKNSEKAIIRWEFVDDDNLSGSELSLIGVSQENRADFDTVISMLPGKVRAEIEEAGEVTLPIINWSCPDYQRDETGDWPFTGEYEFIAELPKEYVCEPPISVLVTLGGAMVNTINDRFTVDGLRYKELGPDTVQLIGYDGAKPVGTLVIPDKVRKPSNGREYQVVSIGHEAFRYCSGLTGDLVIPDTVTEIGDSAFEECHFTGELTLSDSLVTIGTIAFYQCGFIGELVLPDGLTNIGYSAFENCSGFTGRLSIPDEITSIGKYAFDNTGFDGFDTTRQEIADLLCASGVDKDKIEVGNQPYQPSQTSQPPQPPSAPIIQVGNMDYQIIGSDTVKLTDYHGNSDTDISIPDRVTDPVSKRTYSVICIGNYAFHNKAITGSLHLPNTLEIIGTGAFAQNYFTGGLNIPASVSDIEPGAFEVAGFTGGLTLEGKLTYLDNYIFHGCGFTGTLKLPDTLTYIGKFAFQDCGFTGRLQFPKMVTEIGERAFNGCDSLDSAYLGPNLQKLGAQVFPESLPLSTDSPRVQLLINTYLNQDVIADTSWDGMEGCTGRGRRHGKTGHDSHRRQADWHGGGYHRSKWGYSDCGWKPGSKRNDIRGRHSNHQWFPLRTRHFNHRSKRQGSRRYFWHPCRVFEPWLVGK